MAKKIIRTITRSEDDDEDEIQSKAKRAIENDPGEQGYSDFLQRVKPPAGCRVKVYRNTQRGRQYCFVGTPQDIDDEAVRLFHAKQVYANEDGDYEAFVEVNGEMRGPFPIPIAPQVQIPGNDSHAGTHGGMADILRLLQAQNERLEARLNAQERTPMVEMVDAMSKLDQMRGTTQPQMPLEAIMKAVEIGQRLGAPAADDWSSLLMSALKDNAPLLLGMFNRLVSKPATPPAPAAPAVETQQPAPPITLEERPTMEQQEELMLQDTIQFLKTKAIKKSDPGLYLRLIEDNRGEDPVYDRLISAILDNDFSAFAAIDPDIEKPAYRDFFRAIYDGVRSIFGPTRSVEIRGGGENGNKADASSNGATRKRSGK
jgi:hypothetical protein